MFRVVSSDSVQGGGQPTPTVHIENMEKQYELSPLCKEVQGSNCVKLRIAFPRYENYLVLRGGTEIWSIQEEGTAIKLRR